jgi:hypothetical protein
VSDDIVNGVYQEGECLDVGRHRRAPRPRQLPLVTGTEDKAWPVERYRDLWLKPDHFSIEGASHWGLVLNRRALKTMIPAVLSWIVNTIQQGRPTS